LGRRGSGANLARFCWPERDAYHDSADRNVMVIIIIEEARAVDHVDSIAATPGVDAIFIGTSDLSFSLGLRGRQDDPLLQDAVARVVAAGKRHGKILGRPAGSPDQVAHFLEQGFLLFQAPTELGFMASGARRYLEPLEKWGDRLETRALY
jgi:2-keto-3-deoxy-L-rhamnonate aldolase RhmA